MSEDAILDYIDSKPFTKNLHTEQVVEQQYGSCTAAERRYGDGHQIFNSHFVFGGRNFYLVFGFILAFLPQQHGIARSAFLWRKRDCIPCCPFCRYFGVAGQRAFC